MTQNMFKPTYIASNKEIIEQLKSNMNILEQHIYHKKDEHIDVEVLALQIDNKNNIETVQIVPIENSINAIVGIGNMGHDNINRSFQMIASKNASSYLLTLDKVNYKIYNTPASKE